VTAAAPEREKGKAQSAPAGKIWPANPLGRHFRLWRDIARSYRKITSFRWLVLGILVGAASGLMAVAFYAGVELSKHYVLTLWAGLSLPAPAGEKLLHAAPGLYRPWVVPLALGLIGLATGFLVKRFIPESIDSGTDGTDAMIKAFHRQEGRIPPLVPLIRGTLAVLTIGAGGSAGREGPISQIGAGIGSFLATRLKLSVRERRVLLLAGAAGGLGAIFRAPWAARSRPSRSSTARTSRPRPSCPRSCPRWWPTPSSPSSSAPSPSSASPPSVSRASTSCLSMRCWPWPARPPDLSTCGPSSS